MLVSSVVDRGFEPLSGQTKGYYIGICSSSANYAALRSKDKDWWARNHDNYMRRRGRESGGTSFRRGSESRGAILGMDPTVGANLQNCQARSKKKKKTNTTKRTKTKQNKN